MDHQYIEDLRALEDKKEAKDKLVEYAEQFNIKVKKTRSFDNIVLDIDAAFKELAKEPMPENNEGLSISDLIDAANDIEGKNDFIDGSTDVKEEAKLLFDAPEAKPAVLNIQAPIGDVTVAVVANQEGEMAIVESPVKPIDEAALKEVVQKIIESEKDDQTEIFELKPGYSPSLIKIGPGNGYVTLPWWIYEWISKTPDWKQKPTAFPHYHGLDSILSLIYYIKREGSVRIRETRNSSFVTLQ
ncbi:minor head protein inhibitor of protease [Pectobacterium bacteriophage PM2]|uniref:Minor capsid protein n=1 Tax=Pectobacterium bacteriophage PM2 TaxID=1429794 RepID=A0A0A0Q0L1_9CAUD|nr:minor head protein inhibitor of protease [Pectobacterium bacteriophage PM2]AHY25166.1 minor capsid protein [Pectobacterium bacteriophage PM2]